MHPYLPVMHPCLPVIDSGPPAGMLISFKERFFLRKKRLENNWLFFSSALVSVRLDMSFVEKK